MKIRKKLLGYSLRGRLGGILGGIALTSIFSPSLLAGDFAGSAQAYYLNKSYSVDKSISTNIAGLYTYLGYDKHSLELGLETVSVQGDDETQQDDLIAVYRNYQIPNWQLSLGVHNADIASVIYDYDSDTDVLTTSPLKYDLNALILGAQYTDYVRGYKNWSMGVDIVSASYNQIENAVGSEDAVSDFTQLSPYYGAYLPAYIRGHYIYVSIGLHAQFFDQSVRDEDIYIAPEVMLKYVTLDTSYSISGQFGENINQFALGGFSYSGDNLLYSSRIDLAVQHSFTSSLFAKASVKYQSYLTQEDANETVTVMHLAIGYNF